MFDKLLESRARRHLRRGSSLAAVAIHGAIIAGSVALTANAAVFVPSEKAEKLFYAQKAPPPEQVAAPLERVSSPSSAPTGFVPDLLPALVAPVVIPDLIPPVNINALSRGEVDFSPASSRALAGESSGSSTASISSGSVFSELQVDRPVALSKGAPSPEYPAALRSAGVTGELTAEFVVDTLGRVVAGSLRIIGSEQPGFSEAVRRVLPEYRFRPAEYGGRKVRQLVRVPFRFVLDRQW